MSEAVEQLSEVLAELRQLYQQLLQVLRRRLEAMKRADSEALSSCTARERFLSQRIREADATRQNLLGDLLPRLGLPPGRGITLGELAERLGEPHRSRLLVLAAGLREVMAEADRANRVAALAASQMLVHFRRVYEAMTAAAQQTGLYERSGPLRVQTPRRLIDAVG